MVKPYARKTHLPARLSAYYRGNAPPQLRRIISYHERIGTLSQKRYHNHGRTIRAVCGRAHVLVCCGKAGTQNALHNSACPRLHRDNLRRNNVRDYAGATPPLGTSVIRRGFDLAHKAAELRALRVFDERYAQVLRIRPENNQNAP